MYTQFFYLHYGFYKIKTFIYNSLLDRKVILLKLQTFLPSLFSKIFGEHIGANVYDYSVVPLLFLIVCQTFIEENNFIYK